MGSDNPASKCILQNTHLLANLLSKSNALEDFESQLVRIICTINLQNNSVFCIIHALIYRQRFNIRRRVVWIVKLCEYAKLHKNEVFGWLMDDSKYGWMQCSNVCVCVSVITPNVILCYRVGCSVHHHLNQLKTDPPIWISDCSEEAHLRYVHVKADNECRAHILSRPMRIPLTKCPLKLFATRKT